MLKNLPSLVSTPKHDPWLEKRTDMFIQRPKTCTPSPFPRPTSKL